MFLKDKLLDISGFWGKKYAADFFNNFSQYWYTKSASLKWKASACDLLVKKNFEKKLSFFFLDFFFLLQILLKKPTNINLVFKYKKIGFF